MPSVANCVRADRFNEFPPDYKTQRELQHSGDFKEGIVWHFVGWWRKESLHKNEVTRCEIKEVLQSVIVTTLEKSDADNCDQQCYDHEHPKRNFAGGFARQ